MKKRIFLPIGLLVCTIVAIVIACHVHYGETVMYKIKSASSHYGVLSEAEKRVIIEKGTELDCKVFAFSCFMFYLTFLS